MKMSQKSSAPPVRVPAEKLVRDIRRAARKHHSAEDKIRIVLEGLRDEESIAAVCDSQGASRCAVYTEGPRDGCFHSSLSYATSPYANMLSALGGLGNS
jgi:transposase